MGVPGGPKNRCTELWGRNREPLMLTVAPARPEVWSSETTGARIVNCVVAESSELQAPLVLATGTLHARIV